MTRWLLAALVFAVAAAAALRCPQLKRRPMHNDEAVNAIKFGDLWEHGRYKYDPNEHHGPTLYYAAYALGQLTGAPDFDHYTENRLRLVTVLFGLGLVALLPLVGDGLGRRGTGWAALFTAVSPAMVFYSRYFIHEMLLVFFTFLALGAGWRYGRTRKLGWALLAGGALGLMAATKETFVICVGVAVLALGLNQLWNRLLDASAPPVEAPRLKVWHLAAAAGVALMVWLVMFTSFFTDASGPLDSLRTYQPWLKRAGGQSPHVHPWYFYFQRLLFFHVAPGPVWTEALLVLLAAAGATAGFRRRFLGHANASLVRFLAWYTFLLAAFYSALAYKTPWCLLGFWHGAVLLAGVGAAVLLRAIKVQAGRIALSVILLAGAGHLAWQAQEADSTYAADRRNPYVYAQTSPDLLNLVAQVEALAAVSPQHENLLLKVVAQEGDYWPLPWYLRRFKHIDWWNKIPKAPITIVSASLHAGLDEDKTCVMPRYFELRPQVFLELYVEKGLWTKFVEGNGAKRLTEQTEGPAKD